MTLPTRSLVVFAKQPLPGTSKTRLQADFTPAEAAQLAAAALDDTLAVVCRSRVERRILALDGDPSAYRGGGLEVLRQPTGSMTDRLEGAMAAVSDSGPALLIGMDTPQVTPSLLEADFAGVDALLGLSDDGGFWAVGLSEVDPGPVFAGIPMSTAATGAAQLARLLDLGLRVRLLPPLRDVDLPGDAEAVAYDYPHLGFSAKYRQLTSARARQPTDRLFDRAFSGSPVTCAAGVGGATLLTMDVDRWSAVADVADEMVVARCEPPVLDLGCGPGRMLVALQRSGRTALGIDSSAAAVRASTLRGGLAIRRRIEEPIPAEGRWGTALLVDGNVGIGGDVTAVLRRCRELVRPGGLVICEADAQHDRDDRDQLVLSGGGVRSLPLPWARIGSSALARVAATLGLFVCEEWSVEDRVFLALRRAF
jgi:glycosyltransferase A (GT-A) superfamily protein (DUF2064 family)